MSTALVISTFSVTTRFELENSRYGEWKETYLLYTLMIDAVEAAGTSSVASVYDQTGRQLHFSRVSMLF